MKYIKIPICIVIITLLFVMVGVCASASETNSHESCVEEHFCITPQNDL